MSSAVWRWKDQWFKLEFRLLYRNYATHGKVYYYSG